jgi:D-alanyl-D-alanine carboxypeptidase
LRWGETAGAFIANPVGQVVTLCIISLVPFFEELGWRGYAQDVLQEKHSALGASLILGVFWSLWHLPASFIPGTYQAGLGIGTLEFWLHFAGIVVLSIVVSWIYINTNRSLFIMVVFHAMINLAGELIQLSELGETIFTFCWVSAALTIALGFGKEMRVHPKKTGAFRFGHVALLLMLVGLGLSLTAPTAGQAQDLKSRFQTELENLHDQYDFPGATAAYILPDGAVEAVATGLADVDETIPMSAESRMLAASIGKTFVSATVLALVHEGKLELDVPISAWLADRPWFDRLPNHKQITLRHLLTHTSGLANHLESDGFARAFAGRWSEVENPFTPEELIGFVLDQPAHFSPGEGWSYTDTGYLVVGLIIMEVTGHTYYEEVTRRFLDPLGLASTGPSNQIGLDNLATGYLDADNPFGLPPQTTTHPGVMAWNPGLEWTGGGLVSNPRDLVVWARALFEGEAMAGDYLSTLLQSAKIRSDIGYGLGTAIHEGGPFGQTYGHGGWIPGYCSSLRYYPKHKVGIAFQINTDIGVMNGDPSIVGEIEQRLADVIMTGADNASEASNKLMK